jgi:phage terminase large subunit-like protein
MFSLRAGAQPRCVVTTTPKPLRLIRELAGDPATVLVRGTSYENLANLAPTFKAQILDSYEGTRLGRQELYAELLDDVPGALWSRAALDGLRRPAAPALRRVVVAIDPAVSASDESSETGIIVAGVGRDGHGYVLADATIKASPASWAGRAIDCYRRYRADRIIAEVNNGGDLVEATIRSVDASVPYKAVHASRGKHTRAEPVAALYERGLIHHVGDTGSFEALEDQMCNWLPDPGVPSPDRMDALVWALTELMLTLVAQSYRVVVVPEDDRDISPI